jgi:hypothetical protein
MTSRALRKAESVPLSSTVFCAKQACTAVGSCHTKAVSGVAFRSFVEYPYTAREAHLQSVAYRTVREDIVDDLHIANAPQVNVVIQRVEGGSAIEMALGDVEVSIEVASFQ